MADSADAEGSASDIDTGSHAHPSVNSAAVTLVTGAAVRPMAESAIGLDQATGEPVARVVLGSGAPAELIGPLAALGIEPVTGACEKRVDLHVDFGGGADAPASVAAVEVSATPVATVLLTLDNAESATRNGDFACDDPLAAACFILSRALGLAEPLLTVAEPMLAVIAAALKAARNRGRVLIEGETGSGKEALVHLIHKAGHRDREFLHVDCAALDDSFDAVALSNPATAPPRPRTLFLDHLGELPPRAQLRLAAAVSANVADTAETNAHKPRLRYIAVANRPAAAAAAWSALAPELRELFGATLRIPPLRDRRADIPLLAHYFLRAINPAMSFAPAAVRTLADYPFPGNVRELQNLVMRFAIVPLNSASRTIGRADVLTQITLAHPILAVGGVRSGSLDEARRQMARQTLLECGGDPDAAARKLGISPRQLFRRAMTAMPRSRKSRRDDRSI